MAEPASTTMISQKEIHDVRKTCKPIYLKVVTAPKIDSVASAKRALVAPISPNKTLSGKVDIELVASPS